MPDLTAVKIHQVQLRLVQNPHTLLINLQRSPGPL